ncbi:MAG: MgtC/SapB family protein [Peptococcaceae bacterium]|nr:MgtC/SapB family protein [Peptococcaceae bacterium]
MITEKEIIIRLVMAVALGGFVGLERERLHVGYRTYSAGFRTHILVCVGSAVCMIVSLQMHDQFKGDAARIAAQVVSGIGFLGAGAILREGLLVRGLTTAASLWVVASVGLAAGAGYFLAATLGTLLVLFALVILGTIEDYVRGVSKYDLLSIVVSDSPEQVGLIGSMLEKQPGSVKRIEVNKAGEPGKVLVEVHLKLPPEANMMELLHSLAALPGVQRVEHRV